MKKRIITFIFLLCLAQAASAQLILQEEDYNAKRNPQTGSVPFMPVLGLTIDQYEFTPVSGGVWVLCCLGGVYFLKKKKG